MKALKADFSLQTPAASSPNVTTLGKNPCEQMLAFGVQNGFKNDPWMAHKWELETGYKFGENFRLPNPSDVFECSENGTELLYFNDTALAGVYKKLQ